MPPTSRTASPSSQIDSSGPADNARAFSMLPPGTVSPVMASAIISQGASAQLETAFWRSEEANHVADTAKKAAASAEQAALRAEEVSKTEPSDPHAPTVAQRAIQAQREALISAQHAELAAYQLAHTRELSGLELEQPPPSGASDRAPKKARPAPTSAGKAQPDASQSETTETDSPDSALFDSTQSV